VGVPSPASLNEVVSAPVVVLTLLLANKKCGLSAAAVAANANQASANTDITVSRMRRCAPNNQIQAYQIVSVVSTLTVSG
jgi:hypothetical protein